MGGVPRSDPGGVGGGAGDACGVGSPSEIPQESPWPEKAEAREAERSQDQARLHCEDIGRSSEVYSLTSSWGCLGPMYVRPNSGPQRHRAARLRRECIRGVRLARRTGEEIRRG